MLAPIPSGSGLSLLGARRGQPPFGISARAGATCIRVNPIAIKRPSLLFPSPLVTEGSARACAQVGDGGVDSSGPLPRQIHSPDPARCPRPAPRSGLRSPLVHHRFQKAVGSFFIGWRGARGEPLGVRPFPDHNVRGPASIGALREGWRDVYSRPSCWGARWLFGSPPALAPRPPSAFRKASAVLVRWGLARRFSIAFRSVPSLPLIDHRYPVKSILHCRALNYSCC